MTPRLPDLRGLPNPAQLVKDVVDAVADVAGTPAEVIRSLRDAAKVTNSELASAVQAGRLPPDPISVATRAVNAVAGPVQGTLNNIQGRMTRLGRY